MIKTHSPLIFSIITLFLLLNPVPRALNPVYAAVPHLLNYQARLTDASGKPIEGLRKITFRIYDAATAGNLLWQGTYNSVTVTKGVFSVLLGDVSDSGFNFATLAFDKTYYLAIQVESEAEMTPRQMIASSGYAIKAEDTEKLGGKLPSDYVLATDITSTPTANKAVKLDANAKLPAIALKVYDSGWQRVTNNAALTFQHSLGTTKVLTQIYVSGNNDGSGYCVIAMPGYYYDPNGNGRNINITSLTTTQISIRTANALIADFYDNSGVRRQLTSGYCRIVMLALE